MINVAVSLKATFLDMNGKENDVKSTSKYTQSQSKQIITDYGPYLLRAIIRHVSAEDTDRNKRHIYIHNRAGAQAEITSIG